VRTDCTTSVVDGAECLLLTERESVVISGPGCCCCWRANILVRKWTLASVIRAYARKSSKIICLQGIVKGNQVPRTIQPCRSLRVHAHYLRWRTARYWKTRTFNARVSKASSIVLTVLVADDFANKLNFKILFSLNDAGGSSDESRMQCEQGEAARWQQHSSRSDSHSCKCVCTRLRKCWCVCECRELWQH
jgi:hypothetical protein